VGLEIHGYKKQWEELTLLFKVSDEIFVVVDEANNFVVCHKEYFNPLFPRGKGSGEWRAEAGTPPLCPHSEGWQGLAQHPWPRAPGREPGCSPAASAGPCQGKSLPHPSGAAKS